MTQREVIQTLLAKQIPERMGLNESFWPFIVENAWGAQGIGPGTDFVSRFNLDLRSLVWFGVPPPRPDLEKVVEESEEWIARRDGWGATTKLWKHKAGTPEHMAFTLSSPAIWARDYRDAVIALDVRRPTDLSAMKEAYAKAMAGDTFITFSSLFVFEDMRRIMGDMVMLESLLLEPEWLHDFNTVITQKYIEWYAWLFSEVGLPDGVHIYEDLGYTRGSFVSPQCHREMVHPYHCQLFRFFKDHSLPIILHTCGDFRPHVSAIVESGVDCVQAMEAKTGMDVVEMADVWKDKLCFMGNIDVRALESGDRARIREACLGKLNGMKALRAPYVCMSDHSIPPTVRVEDYEYMLTLFWAHCAY